MTGTYLGWVDSNDWLAPTTLAETVKVLNTHPDCGLTYTDHWIVNENDEVLKIGQRCMFPYSPVLLLKVLMTYHFRLIRRSVFDGIGGINTLYPYAYDYDLCLRLSEQTEVKHIPQPLYYYRVHPEAISSKKQQLQMRDTWAAIAATLERRGLSDRYEVKFDRGKYAIARK
ncbi:MAG: hypothetical protein QNJ72_18140 [Pleurocapsa sp. MO_226.B13]|nr:hypothetical protein [Pleurocapsa sp. MO_226.B13]